MTDYSVAVDFPPLEPARMLRRPSRFLAMVGLTAYPGLAQGPHAEPGMRAHVPSSGRMGELLYPGAPVLITVPHVGLSAQRSTECTVVLARHFGDLVCVDSHLPNRLAAKAYRAGALGADSARSSALGVRSEVGYGGERLDLLLEGEAGHTLVEVKSVTLVKSGTGLFPDAPTQRGTRQLLSLSAAAANGLGVEVLFVVQRSDAVRVRPNDAMDPAFGAALRAVAASGGRVRAVACSVTPRAVSLGAELPVDL